MPLCLRDQDLDGRPCISPSASLAGGYGPDFQEARSTALPLTVPGGVPLGAPASLDRFLRIRMPVTTAREGTTGPDYPTRRMPVRTSQAVTSWPWRRSWAPAVWVGFDRDADPWTSPRTESKGVRLLTLDRPFPAEGRYPSDPYVGPQVCAECHPGESALYARSGHAQTLSPAGRRSLARRLDGTTIADPENAEVLWSYRYRDGQLHISRTAQGKVEECIAEYAFGSGHHAMTFVSVIDPGIPAILEHRHHLLREGTRAGADSRPRRPSRARPALTPRGGVLLARDARKCFGCHTTQASARATVGRSTRRR